MASTFKPDSPPDDIGGIDHLYYQRQVPPSSIFNDQAFAMAAAAAKDKARVELIKAIRKASIDARYNETRLGSLAEFARDGASITRSIDGEEGAPENKIIL